MAEGTAVAPARTRREPYTRVILPTLTDEELLDHEFMVENPHLLPNLSEEEPPRDQDLTLVGRYKLGAKVKCVFGHHHKSGFAFRSQDGRHFLVGKICGVNVMGVEAWQDFDREQGGVEERAKYLRQIRTLQDALRQREDWVLRLRTSPPIQALAGVRNMLGHRRDLVQAVRTAFKFHDGRIDRIIQVRNIQAEIQREEREQVEIDRFNALSPKAREQYLMERSAPALTSGQIKDDKLVEIGTLAGRPLFTEHPYSSAKQVRIIIEQIDALLALDTAGEQTSQLKRLSIQARSMMNNLLSIREEVEEAIRFFSRANLEILTTWANDRSYDNSTYAVGPSALLIQDGNTGHDIRIARPPELRLLEPEGFEELQAASAVFTRLD